MQVKQFVLLMLGAGMLIGLAGEPVRAAPNVTVSVTMSNPICAKLLERSGMCVINIRSISAAASDSTFSHLDISIDGKVRARFQTFFETSIDASNRMLGRGFEVACGGSGVDGDANYGYMHQVGYMGYVYGVSVAATYGIANVYCPYSQNASFLPNTEKSKSEGW